MILHFETMHASSERLEEKRIDIIEFLKTHVKDFDQSKFQVMLSKIKESGFATIVKNYQFKIVGVALLCKEKMGLMDTNDILEFMAIHKDFRNSGIGQQLIEKLKINTDPNFDVRDNNLANDFFEKQGLTVKK